MKLEWYFRLCATITMLLMMMMMMIRMMLTFIFLPVGQYHNHVYRRRAQGERHSTRRNHCGSTSVGLRSLPCPCNNKNTQKLTDATTTTVPAEPARPMVRLTFAGRLRNDRVRIITTGNRSRRPPPPKEVFRPQFEDNEASIGSGYDQLLLLVPDLFGLPNRDLRCPGNRFYLP